MKSVKPLKSILKTLGFTVIVMLSQSVNAVTSSFYQVKSGDTLQSIANQYDTTVNTLININNLKDKNDIKVGDKIYLTDASALTYRGKTTSYIVQNGDTLSSIAKKFNTKVSVLTELNEMQDSFDKLYVGNTITVPMTAPVIKIATVQPTVKASETLKTTVITKPKTETSEYYVKSGETLFGIANKFKVDKNELMALNGLDHTAKVNIGQKLIIPNNADRMNAILVDKTKTTVVATPQVAKKTTTTTAKTATAVVDFTNYKVKAGDTLSSIANRYNTTVAGLIKINSNLTSASALKAGQVIVVPVHDDKS